MSFIIEGFGGKRALGFLLKSELCQKRSKFHMQFCLHVSNNVLHVFSLKFAFFLKYYVCEKHIFPRREGGGGVLELGNPGGRGVLAVWEIQSGGGQKCLPSIGGVYFF